MFNDPIGFKKPELSDIDKMFTKEYKGDGIYVIFKNGKEVKRKQGIVSKEEFTSWLK
jgi:predicted AlkP superfamily phosphohydrolase/phosphomutase